MDFGLLESREAVRKRPGMYIGDTGTTGLHHLFKEIIDNSIDEVMAGHCDQIKVTLGKDRSITVEDNGRGIPVDINKQTGMTGVQLVMTELHAGGKFGNGGYKTSGGLHGVGASCVNALSEWVETTVRRDGKIYRMRFERGVPVTPLDVIGTCGPDEHGTTQRWMADRTIFAAALNDAGELDYRTERLEHRILHAAYLNKEVTIHYRDALHDAEPVVFHFPQGIAEYVVFLNDGKETLHDTVIHFHGQQEETQVEIAVQYNCSDQVSIYAFANNIPQRDGGTHVTGFKSGLTRAINQYAHCKGFLKREQRDFTGDEVRTGMTAVVSIRLTNPMFRSATKSSLANPEVEGIVNRAVGEGIYAFLEGNPGVARVVLEKIDAAAQGRDAARWTVLST